MTSIRENQENAFAPSHPGHRKEAQEVGNNHRKVLGGLSQNIQQQREIFKQKSQLNEVNLRAIDNAAVGAAKGKGEKDPSTAGAVVPPVAQFQAFSVYEDPAEEKAPLRKHIPPKKEDKHLPSSILDVLPQSHRNPLQTKIEDVIVESPMSVGLDNSLCPMSISRSETKQSPDDEKKATAKSVRELFFHVAEYRDDIYKYMREIEWKHRPKPGYMRKQPDISHSMRAILVDWLVEVGEEYHLHTETLYLAVSYIDRFLSYMSVVRAKLQLVGTAAMFIASKYEEIYPPVLGEFVYITDDTYTKQQVLRMEHLILKVLSFDLSTPTPLAFISHFCIANGLSQKAMFLAMYISELSLLEAEPYLHFPSSVVAAASLVVARHTLLCCHCDKGDEKVESNNSLSGVGVSKACEDAAWPEQLRRCSGYTPAQLEKCGRFLERTHASSLGVQQRAIPDKYKSSKYEAVSLIEPKPMYPAMDPEEKSLLMSRKLNDSNNSVCSNQSKLIADLDDSNKKSLKES